MSPPPYVSSRFLDTSKQAIGMLFIHFANVYLSDLTEEDPCSLWVCVSAAVTVVTTVDTPFSLMCPFPSPRYLINFLLDATLGMLVIYGGVKAVSAVVEWRQWDPLRFGEYGEDPSFFKCISLIKRHILLSTVDCLTVQFVPWRTLCLGLIKSCHFIPLNVFHSFVTYRFLINSII